MSYSKFKKKLQVRPILNTKTKFVTGSSKKGHIPITNY